MIRQILASILPVLPAAAQEETRTVPWPNSSSSFVQSVVGDFTDDLRISAVVLRGTSLELVFQPGFYESSTPLGFTGLAKSIATLDRGPGNQDDLLITSNVGLSLAVFVSADIGFSFTLLQGAPWINATGLRVGNDITNDAHAIGAIAAGGTSIVTGVRDSIGNYAPGPLLTPPGDVKAVEVLDWDVDGVVDYVALTTSGVYPYRIDGTAMPSVAQTGIVEASTVSSHPVSGDHIAYVVDAGGSFELHLRNALNFRSATIDTSGLQLSAPLSATGLSAADKDDDGDLDILLSHNGSFWALVMEVRPVGESKALAIGLQIPIALLESAGDPSLNGCPGVYADLDDTGIPEGLFFLDSVPAMVVVHDMDGLGANGGPQNIIEMAEYDGTIFDLDIADLFQGTADTLEVVIWHQADPQLSSTLSSQNATYANSWLLSATQSTGSAYEISFELDPDPGTTTWWADRDHYYVEIRYVDNASKTVTFAETVGLTVRPNSAPTTAGELIAYYLFSRAGQGAQPVDIERTSFDMEVIGGIQTRTFPPPFPGGGVPNPGGL